MYMKNLSSDKSPHLEKGGGDKSQQLSSKRGNKRIIIVILCLLLFVLVFCTIDIYFLGYKTFLSKYVSKAVPYPAIIINNDLLTVSEYNEFLSDYELLLEDGLEIRDFQNSIFKFIVESEILEQIISKLDIQIDSKEFNYFIKNFYNISNLKDSVKYKDEFEYYIIMPLFYRQKISEKLGEDELNLENKKIIEKIYENLLYNTDKFDDYVAQYKDENLFSNDNVISWLPHQDLPNGLQGKIDKMDVNDFTPIIKSASGYHIFKLKGKIEKEDIYYYQISQIFLPLNTFENYFSNFLKNSRIYYLFKK